VARLVSGGDAWIHLPKISGWGYSKDFPTPASRSFQSRYRKHAALVENKYNRHGLLDEIRTDSHGILASALTPEPRGTNEFQRELEALGGRFTLCSSDKVAEKVQEILQSHEIYQLLAWDAQYLPAHLLEQLSRGGIQISHPTAETLHADSPIRAGLTGAYAGLADTGSLVLLGGQGRPMTASLLPELHIAVLWEKDIYEDLYQVIARDEFMKASSVVFITGPSRTSDIEMTLTIGVHGPGELHVICLRDQ
jgi:L-lactate dehydrogenase complex protein LldG